MRPDTEWWMKCNPGSLGCDHTMSWLHMGGASNLSGNIQVWDPVTLPTLLCTQSVGGVSVENPWMSSRSGFDVHHWSGINERNAMDPVPYPRGNPPELPAVRVVKYFH